MKLNFPDIPKTGDQEMYNYCVMLHQNFKNLEAAYATLEQRVAALEKKGN